MPLIDDRGRVFGRVNVIDATIIAVVVVLMPIAYTAARLFLAPQPQIERVEPSTQLAGAGRRIQIVGRNLRPFLRAVPTPNGFPSLIDPGRIIEAPAPIKMVSPSLVEAELPDLKPGVYDLRLFDSTREVARLASAFTLTAPQATRRTETRAIARVTARYAVFPEAARLIHEGDADLAGSSAAASGDPARTAVVRRVRVVNASLPASIDFGAGWGSVLVELEIDVPVHRTPRGDWAYGQQPIRIGDVMNFGTTEYTLHGLIGLVKISQAADVVLDGEEAK